MSSSGSSFFSMVMVLAALMGAAVYGIKHRDEVAKFASISGKHAAAPGREHDAKIVSHTSSDADVEIAATEAGHFETEAEINGARIDVMVDTGATLVALTYEDAQRAGIYLNSADFTYRVKTANGIAKVAPVEISSIAIGDITVRNVRGAVTEPGKLHKTLLGMSFLNRLSRVEMRPNGLALHE